MQREPFAEPVRQHFMPFEQLSALAQSTSVDTQFLFGMRQVPSVTQHFSPKLQNTVGAPHMTSDASAGYGRSAQASALPVSGFETSGPPSALELSAAAASSGVDSFSAPENGVQANVATPTPAPANTKK